MYDHERGLCLPESPAPAPEPLSSERDAQDLYGNAALQEHLREQHSGSHGGDHDPLHALATAAVLGEATAAAYEMSELAAAGHSWPHASRVGPNLGAASLEAGAESSAFGAVTRAGGVAMGHLAMCVGAMEIAAAQESFEQGDDAEAVHQTIAGELSVLGGLSTTATALLGAEAVGVGVASAGPVCAAAGLGLLAGHTADQAADASGLVTRTRQVQDRGLASEPRTEQESLGMSEWLTEQMAEVREETGSDVLAVGAGIAMLAHLPTLWALDGAEHRPLQPRTDAAVCE